MKDQDSISESFVVVERCDFDWKEYVAGSCKPRQAQRAQNYAHREAVPAEGSHATENQPLFHKHILIMDPTMGSTSTCGCLGRGVELCCKEPDDEGTYFATYVGPFNFGLKLSSLATSAPSAWKHRLSSHKTLLKTAASSLDTKTTPSSAKTPSGLRGFLLAKNQSGTLLKRQSPVVQSCLVETGVTLYIGLSNSPLDSFWSSCRCHHRTNLPSDPARTSHQADHLPIACDRRLDVHSLWMGEIGKLTSPSSVVVDVRGGLALYAELPGVLGDHVGLFCYNPLGCGRVSGFLPRLAVTKEP